MNISSLIFYSVLFSIDVFFHLTRLRQWIGAQLVNIGILRTGSGSGGFEDELEKSVRGFAKGQFGVELSGEAFQG
jgi:aarF domain-containing kinase